MAIKRYTGSAFADVSARKRWDGGAWVNLTFGRRWDGSKWIDLWTNEEQYIDAVPIASNFSYTWLNNPGERGVTINSVVTTNASNSINIGWRFFIPTAASITMTWEASKDNTGGNDFYILYLNSGMSVISQETYTAKSYPLQARTYQAPAGCTSVALVSHSHNTQAGTAIGNRTRCTRLEANGSVIFS